MAGSSPFTLMTIFLSLNLANSVKTFREIQLSLMAVHTKEGCGLGLIMLS